MIYNFCRQFHSVSSATRLSIHVVVIKDFHGIFTQFVFLVLLDLLILFAEERLNGDASGTGNSQHDFAMVSELLIIKVLRVDNS
jgi:hypothetical protein